MPLVPASRDGKGRAAVQEIAELSVVRLALVRERAEPYKVGGPEDAAAIVRRFIGDAAQETFLVLLLDTKLRVNAAHIAAVGTLESCPVSPRAVFTAALLAGAASVILAHCHPSGDPFPSPEDRAITQRLVEAGELLGIPVQDHVIVGSGNRRAFSFREHGIMPEPDGARGAEADVARRPRSRGSARGRR